MKLKERKLSYLRIIALFMVLISMLTGCSAVNEKKSVPAALNTDNFTISGDYIEIPCEYGTLKYPAVWRELLAVEYNDEKDQNVISLFYCDEDQKTELAHITFGDINGFVVGRINDINISVTLCDTQEEKLSDSGILNYCAMLEDVNVLISHLTELEDFSLQ